MTNTEIINATEDQFEANKRECNWFLYNVARQLGVHLPAGTNANGLFDHMASSSEWQLLGTGVAGMQDAVTKALDGKFVVAAQKGDTHGHVAVIIGVDRDGTPRASWGQHGSVGQKNGRLSRSWRRSSFPYISYFVYAGS